MHSHRADVSRVRPTLGRAALTLFLIVASSTIARGQTDSAATGGAKESQSSGAPASLESMNEQLQTLQTDVDKLKRLKFSGYVQARWERLENQSDTVKVTGNPATLTPANWEGLYMRS